MIAPSEDRPVGQEDKAFYRSLLLRIVSALVLIPIVLLVTYFGGVIFAVIIAAAGIVMSIEWSLPAYKSLKSFQFVLQAVTTVLAVFCVVVDYPVLSLGCVAAATGIGILYALAIRQSVIWPLLGIPYTALFCFAAVWLRDDAQFGAELIYCLLVIVWATDTFAYVFGKSIGGPKLAPVLSPNKTWSGLLGGMTAAGFCAALYGLLRLPDIVDLWILACLGVGLGAVAQAGDLFESGFKRHFGLKDSGAIIPGHGGLLDRIDGLVFAVLAAAMIAVIRGGAEAQAGAVLIW